MAERGPGQRADSGSRAGDQPSTRPDLVAPAAPTPPPPALNGAVAPGRPAPVSPPLASPVRAAAEAGLHSSSALLAMLGIALVVLLSALDMTIVGTALPRVVAELQGFELYAWVATSYLLTSTVMIPIIGKLGDLYGRKPFLLLSIAIFVGSSAAAGAAPSMLALIAARGVQGIGAGMITATAFATVGDMFPQPHRRARWQGIITSTFGLASIVGPSLGGVMTDTLGWRSVFYINLPIGLLAIIVLWCVLPADLSPRRPDARIDWLGAAVITVAVSALLLALELGGRAGSWASPTLLGLLLVGLAGAVAFIAIERRVPEPLLPFDLFRSRILVLCSLLSTLLGVAMFGLVFFTPLFAQGALGMSPSAAGALLTPLVVSMAAGSLTSGQTFARVRRARPLLLLGCSFLALGSFALTRITTSTDHLLIGAILGLCGLGAGMLIPLLTLVVQATVPRQRLGISTAMVQFLRAIGSTLGTGLVGVLVSGGFASRLAAAIPPGTDPRLAAALADPEALVSPQAQEQLLALAAQIGPDGPEQLQRLLAVSREALAASVGAGYVLVLAIALVSLGLILFLLRTPPPATASARSSSDGGQRGASESVL